MQEFLANYRGKVIDNTGDKGRCKIYVPSIHPSTIEGISSDSESYASKLPWSEPACPLFAGSTDGQGMCSWPEVGSWVWVFFEGGLLKNPVYFAAINGGNAWVSEHNNQYVIQTQKTKLTIDDNTGEVTLIVAKGVNIETPITTIKGDAEIDGELHVTGNIAGDAEVQDYIRTMSGDRIIFNAHKHIGDGPSSPPSETSTPLTPQ